VAEPRRQAPHHVPGEVRDAAIAALSAFRSRGRLYEHVTLVAREVGVAERTVWRWVTSGDGANARRGRTRFEVTAEDIAELAYRHGSVAAVHRARGGEPSVWTLRRAFVRALSPGRMAGLEGGERVRRNFDTYLTRPARHRNECWEADHCELAIEVLLADGQVIKPWLTSFLDRFSRAVCGWAISGYPSEESVLAALRAAILTEPPYGPVGGIPASLRWDRGKEFLADGVGSAARALGIDAQPLPPYAPHLKGALERFHESIETLLLAELPGFTHAPVRRRERRSASKAALLTLDAFVTCFAEFVARYNAEHAHSALDGDTPLERWLGDDALVVEMPRERLHHLLLARDTRVVGKWGIRIFGNHYNAAELVGVVGETVEVRFMPHQHGSIEVFLHEHHVGTAVRVDLIDEEEAAQLRRRRREEERWLARQQRDAERRRARRFQAVTAAPPPIEEAEPERVLTPSRSLIDHGEIPAGWVRPLAPDEVPDPPPRRSRR
jgi:putative transposase